MSNLLDFKKRHERKLTIIDICNYVIEDVGIEQFCGSCDFVPEGEICIRCSMYEAAKEIKESYGSTDENSI